MQYITDFENKLIEWNLECAAHEASQAAVLECFRQHPGPHASAHAQLCRHAAGMHIACANQMIAAAQ